MMKKSNLNKSRLVNGALGVALSLAAFSCSGKDDQQAQQQGAVPEVEVETVTLGSATLESSYPATIKGKTDIDIRPQVSGFITKVHVDEGQRVHKGQVLFTLDQVQYQAAVDQAKAMVNSAQAAVNTAKTYEQNQKMLFDKGIISQTNWQTAADQLAQAQAALAQANAGLTNARKNLSYTVVVAPSDGVVGSIPNREGSLASPSSAQPLTTISDISEMYAYFSLNENDLLAFTEGGTRSLDAALTQLPSVKLRMSNGTEYPFEGKVATVSGVIDSSTGAAQVRALFPNPSGMLRSGASGSVIMPAQYDSVVVIPQTATFENQSLRMVYAVNDSNVTMPTPIQVAPLNDGKVFVVTSGLTPGQRIVVEGVNTVVRGSMPIKPLTAGEKAARAANTDRQAAQ